MKLAVVGATGMVGSRVISEAVARGHDITAICRNQPAPAAPGVSTVNGDANDHDHMRTLLAGHHAVVAAIRPSPGDEHTVTTTTAALLDAAAATETRILVVGGAGPLRSPGRPDQLVVDNATYVPAAWRDIAKASVAQLHACHAHPANWVYLSPPAILEPGRRTGTYRRGDTTLLTRADGTSGISVEDLAVAVIDEIENPHEDKHFTVAD